MEETLRKKKETGDASGLKHIISTDKRKDEGNSNMEKWFGAGA